MTTHNHISAIIVAGGSGQRMGSKTPKQFLKAGSRTILEWSTDCFLNHTSINLVVVAVPQAWITETTSKLKNHVNSGRLIIVAGGDTRQKSVENALAAISDNDGWVAIHDAARPGIDKQTIDRVLNDAFEFGAAICALQVVDTVVKSEQKMITNQVDRENLFRVQTPQVFKISLMRKALANAKEKNIIATDDASLVRELGIEVKISEGSELNNKITREQDLALFKRLKNIQD